MTWSRQMTFWVLFFAAAAAAFWLLREILLPFVAGMAMAYLLSPVSDRLENLGLPRLAATLIVISVFVLAFVLLILLAAPLLARQLADLFDHLPGYFVRLQAVLADQPWLRRIIGEGLASDKSFGDLVTQGVGWIAAFVRSIWSGGRALLSIFSLVVVTPVVAFYLIYDWPRMIATVDRWVPEQQRETVRTLAREMDDAIAGFVRGQTAVCIILGSYYALALSLVGLNFGLLVGLLSGLISFIPYVGSLTGLVLSVGIAIAQFWPDWTWILVVLGIFLFGQFVEGYILSPKLVGESVGLHPVWLMFALFAFGYLFGFVGLLVAVPVSASIGVLARFALQQYLASPLYPGEAASISTTISLPKELPPPGGETR
jgi:predicted PurR-regulated permease PerM